jgi:hypothetical protein
VVRWEVKRVKRWGMDFVTSSRNKFIMGFTLSDWNFDANIGRIALGWNFYLNLRGICWAEILMECSFDIRIQSTIFFRSEKT